MKKIRQTVPASFVFLVPYVYELLAAPFPDIVNNIRKYLSTFSDS